MIHKVQNAYRSILYSMARPGDVCDISKEGEDLDSPLILLSIMLLDGEVSFNLVSKEEINLSKTITQLTYSKVKSIEDTDYLFILDDVEEQEKIGIIKMCKVGDLVDPQKATTVIVQVEDIKSGIECILKGPGIKDMKDRVIPLDKEVLNIRNEKNIEYPLGIDMIIVDKKSKVMCIPRTTVIEIKEV